MNKILHGDWIEVLTTLADKSVNCCVTSPPYFGLRDYNVPPFEWPEIEYSILGMKITVPAMTCCLGLETTPEAYVGHLVYGFRQVYRVVKDDGTLWLNIADSYAGYHGNKNYGLGETTPSDKPGYRENMRKVNMVKKRSAANSDAAYLKPKDLIGIPWMVAFALRDDGWYLRQDIIWHKPNQMPESVTDRCTKAHEYFFMLSKAAKYYFDQEAILQKIKPSVKRDKRLYDPEYQNKRPDKNFPGDNDRGSGLTRKNGSDRGCPEDSNSNVCASVPWEGMMANKRSVWTITTKPFKEAHFATFPQELVVDPIKAGCPENGIVLDPFSGAGTTGLVARKLGRNFIGIELNENYIQIANERIKNELGLFAPQP